MKNFECLFIISNLFLFSCSEKIDHVAAENYILKSTEEWAEAIYFLSEIPLSENKILTERYRLLHFNPVDISKDTAFLSSLKHISYITTIELEVKKNLLIPRLKDLQYSVDKALLQ